jgi:hypothetical protein
MGWGACDCGGFFLQVGCLLFELTRATFTSGELAWADKHIDHPSHHTHVAFRRATRTDAEDDGEHGSISYRQWCPTCLAAPFIFLFAACACSRVSATSGYRSLFLCSLHLDWASAPSHISQHVRCLHLGVVSVKMHVTFFHFIVPYDQARVSATA